MAMLVLGLGAILVSACLPTTVPLYPILPANGPMQEWVYNLPASQRKWTCCLLSGVAAIVGAVLLGFGTLINSQQREP